MAMYRKSPLRRISSGSLIRDAEIAKYTYSKWYYGGREKGELPIRVHIHPPRAGARASRDPSNREQTLNTAKHIVDNIEEPITLALEELGIDKRKIDLVYMAGGASRMPLARQLVEIKFGSDKVKRSSNPRKEIAYGAAYSEWYQRVTSQRSYKGVKTKNALLIAQQKRSPWYSRGRELQSVLVQPLIKAGAEVDAFRTPRVYRLVVPEDGHREIVIPIYEQTADDEATTRLLQLYDLDLR